MVVGTLSGGVVMDSRGRGGAMVALRPALSSARLQGLRSLRVWEDHLWRLLTYEAGAPQNQSILINQVPGQWMKLRAGWGWPVVVFVSSVLTKVTL